MRRYLMVFILFAVFAGCEKDKIGHGQPSVRIRFKNEIPGNISYSKVKLFYEKDSVLLGPLAQGEYSKYIDGTDFYIKGIDASPADFYMLYRLSINNIEMSYSFGMLTRVASATTQKLEPGDYTILIRRIETQPNTFGFSFTIQ